VENGTGGPQREPRVALIHDFLLDVRGAERVFIELCRMWPDADIFTTVYDEEGTEGWFAGRRIHTSFLQRVRPSARSFRTLLPLYPVAIESFDLSGYDLVISSSSAWAHAIVCDEHTAHVSYCHNPFRYAWNDRERTLARRDPVTRLLLRALFHHWRQWDWIAAQRTDRYVANSQVTQARIRSYFGREARVVYPPVDTRRFSPGPVDDHYALVSELMPHKDIELAIEAFNLLKLPLIVIGDGPSARRLRRTAGPTIRFAGRQTDAAVEDILQAARALVVTSIEEFGIAAVESQAAGRPVIARRGGGALETIVEGVTGCFWSGTAADLASAILNFDDSAVDPEACVRSAARFDAANFRRAMGAEVEIARAGKPPASVAEHPPPRRARLVRRASREARRGHPY
jgi:glycosyltransferase involved in cell wall biosynthesis